MDRAVFVIHAIQLLLYWLLRDGYCSCGCLWVRDWYWTCCYLSSMDWYWNCVEQIYIGPRVACGEAVYVAATIACAMSGANTWVYRHRHCVSSYVGWNVDVFISNWCHDNIWSFVMEQCTIAVDVNISVMHFGVK